MRSPGWCPSRGSYHLPLARKPMGFPAVRLRRLRRTERLRDLVRETRLAPGQLIQPYFVVHGEGVSEAISAMPGQRRLSVDVLVKEAKDAHATGIGGVILFGLPRAKDETGSEGYSD